MNYDNMSYDEFLLYSEQQLNECEPGDKAIMTRYFDVVAYQHYGVPLPECSKPVEIPFRLMKSEDS